MMLFEPGPLRLFLTDEIPMPTARGIFVNGVAPEIATMNAATAALEAAGAAIAPGIGGASDLASASDLAAAVAEHDRQAREADSAIADVAAGAGSLEGVLAGLTGELASELADASLPDAPDAPDEGENEDWKDPEYKTIINEWFNKYLGHDAPDDYLDELQNGHQRFVDVLAGILSSEEYQERLREGLVQPTTPGSRPGGGAGGGTGGSGGGGGGGSREYSDDRLREYLEAHPEQRGKVDDFLRRNPGDDSRAGEALELPDF